MGCCGCWRIVGLLVLKNFLLQFRSWVFTIFELILPVLYIAVLVALKTQFSLIHHPERTWEPIPLNNVSDINSTLTMTIPFVAPFPKDESMKNFGKTILFAPDTDEVKEIANIFQAMEYFSFNGFSFLTVEFKKNESEMIEFLSSKKNSTDPTFYSSYLGGVTLKNITKEQGIQFEYSIHLDDELRPSLNLSKLEEIFNVTSTVALIKKIIDEISHGVNLGNNTKLLEAVIAPKGDWRTNILFPRIAGQGPRAEYDNFTGKDPGYIYQGYIPIQAALEQAIIQYRKNQLNTGEDLNFNIKLQQYPYRSWIQYDFSFALAYGLPLLLMLSFIIPTMFIVRSLVYEKEKKLKESLKIMGASGLTQKFAWFLKNFLFQFVTIIMIMFLVVGGHIFVWASNFLFFLFLLLYTMASIAFATLIATFFSKTNVATVMSGVIFFMTYVPYFFLQNDENYDQLPYQGKIILCLLSNTALALGSRLFSEFEARGDSASFANIRNSPIPGDQFALLYVLIMLWFDFKLYTILAWYIDNVFPGDFGVPKPFYFLCLPSYWCSTKKKRYRVIGNERHEFIESEPRNEGVGIEIMNLGKVFGGLGQKKKKAVDGISLKMYKGQITVLLGHNGAGKTTTMSMLTGLFPPTTGTAEVNGYDICRQISKVRESLGLCPQHDVLYDNMTVREHLWFFGMLKGSSWSEVRIEADELMNALGIHHKNRTYTKNLSGGMKRKLSVGIALIGKSEVVILDEPTTGMDPGARRDTWDLLLRYKNERTIMLTTHYMDEADFLGDRIAIMASGVIKCCGSPLFLKSKFGVGYHMTCVKEQMCNVPAITQLITQHVPEAKLQSNVGAELTYILPKNMSQKFPKMFDELQLRKDRIGIASYGVSITTMEEVFLQVGAQDDEELETLLAGRKLIEPDVIGAVAKEIMPMSPVDVKNLSLNIASIEQTKRAIQNSRQSPARENITEATPLNNFPRDLKPKCGAQLWFLQFYAMIVKRYYNTIRNYKAIIPQLLLPTMFTLLALIVSITVPGLAEQRPLEMTPNLYRQSIIPILTDFSSEAIHRSNTLKLYLETNTSAQIVSMNTTNTNESQIGEFILNAYKERSNIDADQFYQFGAEYRGSNITAWFSNQGFHMVPLALNQISNALLRSIPGAENDEIVGYNAPQPADLKTKANNLVGLAVGFSVAFDMVFGMAFLASSFVVFVVDERSCKSKHIQRVSGVHLSSFWLSAFLWDIFNYILPCLFILVLFMAFQVPAFKNEKLLIVALLLLEYGWSIIPLMYLFSYFFNRATTAFVLTVLFNIGTGCAAVLIIFLLDLLKLTDAANAMKWIFLFMPNYCLGQALSEMVAHDYYKGLCLESKETEFYCRDLGIDYQSSILAIESPGVGKFVIAMAVEGLFFLFALYVLESNILKKFWKLIWSPFHKLGPRPVVDITNNSGVGSYMDSDVLNEQAKVTTEDISHYNSPRASQNILTLYNIGKTYRNTLTLCDQAPALRAVIDVCLEVKRGEIFGLLGQNGAGKSSTFKMITGDEDISSGSAFINGIDLRYGIEKASALMGYCPQYDALIDRMTGRELLTMFGRIRGLNGPRLDAAVGEIIERLYLTEYGDKLCGTYSGGNKRKLCTGIALVGDPPLLLLDEPTSGMDPVSKRLLWDTLSEYSQEGHCIVITSHSMEECEALCNRLTIMVNGRMKCLGTLQHLKNKFGSGYTLTVKSKQNQGQLQQHIKDKFPDHTISRAHTGMINFKIPQHAAKLSEIFACMEEIRDTVDNYGVTQTTLEQVFLDLTAEQDDADK